MYHFTGSDACILGIFLVILWMLFFSFMMPVRQATGLATGFQTPLQLLQRGMPRVRITSEEYEERRVSFCGMRRWYKPVIPYCWFGGVEHDAANERNIVCRGEQSSDRCWSGSSSRPFRPLTSQRRRPLADHTEVNSARTELIERTSHGTGHDRTGQDGI